MNHNTESLENYESPELFELGQAEELTLGLDDGAYLDFHGFFRIQRAIVPEMSEE